MKNSTESFDIRPGVESLLTYRHHGYETWYALAELVDNSVASFRIQKRSNPQSKLKKLQVSIEFDRESKSIVIVDNAAGINLDRLQDALIAGKPPKDKSDLNQFGMGMKTASFWFGSKLSIETFPLDQNIQINVDLDLAELIKNNAEVIPVITQVTGSTHGTRIMVEGLWPERSIPTGRTLAKVRDYLSSIYRNDIKSGLLELSVGGKVLETLPHKVLEAPRWDDKEGPSQRWEKLIEIDLEDKQVTGVVWLLETGDTANAGLVLTWQGKAIVGAGAGANDSNDSYRPQIIYGRSNSFVSQRLMGELDMSAYPVTTKKDGLSWTEEQQEKFAQELKIALDLEPLPLIKMATMYRKNSNVVDTREDIRSALVTVKTAFEKISVINDGISSIQNIELDTSGEKWTQTTGSSSSEDNNYESMQIDIPSFVPGMRSGELRVIHEPMITEVFRWRRDSDDTILIEVNRASIFLENYSALPKYHLEPTLLVCAAMVIAEIMMEAGGSRMGRDLRERVNQLLNGPLGNLQLGVENE